MERVELDRNGIDEASLEEIKKLLEASGKESILGSLDHNDDY